MDIVTKILENDKVYKGDLKQIGTFLISIRGRTYESYKMSGISCISSNNLFTYISCISNLLAYDTKSQ